jgi:hypothetical protein
MNSNYMISLTHNYPVNHLIESLLTCLELDDLRINLQPPFYFTICNEIQI